MTAEKRILVHMCCGPCSIYPVQVLREAGMTVMGFYYGHNIHPYTECRRRRETLDQYAETAGFKVIHQKDYDLEGFLRSVVFREADRCRYCYHDRLKSTALLAGRGRFDFFTSTLLYSRYQKHDVIRAMGESLAKSTGVPFFYHDFREGWEEGIAASKRLGMYRQQYCGCIYSEAERYRKKRS
ncbi:epoxyqueuosine reductase QueH [Desulfococcus multivorans]|uniref:Epoxyqueuosine reductase QueH n=1 Tax=Desulfococcus multivorans DSM 2059 TaxID=1121405 RepID=S7U1N8_DESML|nr:epoxyqueuosine reductase QueH [Desulfococcus multivorans]EPR42930.1 protein of unknown function DUF208 [Desulfococcus multivorans DSM 2059]SJZ50659.1 hypothetical protein SAMN02745446_00730 [Desulfococcus multivorans DSM 2059]